jgi:Domain of unknown function (DUF4160)
VVCRDDDALGPALPRSPDARRLRRADWPWVFRAAWLMPRISAFYGIVIWMYHDEAHHSGRPHFHAVYGGDEATIDIESLAILAGELPPRGWRLVVEWARVHQSELRANWARARSHQPLAPIDPLR